MGQLRVTTACRWFSTPRCWYRRNCGSRRIAVQNVLHCRRGCRSRTGTDDVEQPGEQGGKSAGTPASIVAASH